MSGTRFLLILLSKVVFFVVFFFFQAEDGIRDIGVTGVQTCALPISQSSAQKCPSMIKFSETKDMDLSDQRTSPQRDLYSICEERSSSDSGSLDRRSSSSFSSDDGAFGEFGGSMETVVLAGEKEGEGTSSESVLLATNSQDPTRDKRSQGKSTSCDMSLTLV